MSEINQYMTMYYEEHIKEEAERCVIIAQQTFNETTEAERAEHGITKLIPLTIHKETAREFWLMESEEIKAEVRASIQALYEEELESWATKKVTPRTAQEYHQ